MITKIFHKTQNKINWVNIFSKFVIDIYTKIYEIFAKFFENLLRFTSQKLFKSFS